MDETAQADLQAKLREKEKLVAVLTSRLEQAAEQLDRARRTGGNRGGKIASIPPELIESQKTLCDELQGAVERWEAAQAVETLGRIESQVAEIRDLVAGGVRVDPGAKPVSQPKRSPKPESSTPAAADGVERSPWEALKEKMLQAPGAEEPASGAAAPTPPPAAESDEDDGSSAEEARDDRDDADRGEPELPDFEPIDPPEPVDVDEADVETLKAAVLARDEYTAHLLQRLRAVESRRPQNVDWDALADAPEELAERLRETQKQLDDQLRRSEVELSLERARLGREAMQLRAQQERLEREAKRLGLGEVDTGEPPDEHLDEDRGNSRWRRMLGLRRDEDE